MSVNKVDKTTGELTLVAGKNVSTMVPSVALQQSGTFSVPPTAVQYGAQTLSIIFTAPMPDTNYEVTFSGPDSIDPWYSMIVRNKTVNGFDVRCICLSSTGVPNSLTYDWQAFRLVSDQTIALDEEAIAKRTAFPDYAHPLTVASTAAWSAPEDCYVVYQYSAAGSSYTEAGQLYINGVRVDGGDFGGSDPGTSNSFSGYLKKGDILTRQGAQPIASTSNCFRFFPLRT